MQFVHLKFNFYYFVLLKISILHPIIAKSCLCNNFIYQAESISTVAGTEGEFLDLSRKQICQNIESNRPVKMLDRVVKSML